MQEMDNQCDEWVCVKNSIVEYDIKINNDDTIGDLKRGVESFSGISVEDQSLCIFIDLLFIAKVGKQLDNNVRIRDAMNQYNTHEFMLSVALSGITVEK